MAVAKTANGLKTEQKKYTCPICEAPVTWTMYSTGGKGKMAFDCKVCGVVSKVGELLSAR